MQCFRKSEDAAALVEKLTSATSSGEGGGGAVIAGLSAEKEKLAEEVDKLKKNDATIMAKLQETMAEAKAAKGSMEKMKKAREKVKINFVWMCSIILSNAVSTVVLLIGICFSEKSYGRTAEFTGTNRRKR